MIKKVLVAYDGSNPSKAAFEFALDLANKYSAELHILAVASAPEFGAEVETEAIIESSRRHYTQLLHSLKDRAAGLTAHFEVVLGHPAESIVLYAEDHGIDHIVVGHRGHSLFERWLLGSVARQVIAYAPCSVTVVRG
ncbi:MAG: universal stress protein [Gammaproteobacteria bacterium]|nr:universal stress protein [Gammaproteobacteria bacterium]MBU1482937.1 universal stress protein [Gammaproteobacteria bacterium]